MSSLNPDGCPSPTPARDFPGFREPVNGFMHLFALLLTLVGTGALLWACREDVSRMVTAAVYGTGMAGCFLASTLHHLVKADRRTEMRLLRWDHAAIFPFIAGSYTPICLHVLPRPSGLWLLGVIWAIALGGVIYKLFFAKDQERVEDPPEMSTTMIYVAMGWLIVFFGSDVLARSASGSFGLALAGGIAYTLGGVILSRKLLDFKPGRFGHHEIWHACVMVGAACVYAYVWANLA